MSKKRVGKVRTFKNPVTGIKEDVSRIVEVVHGGTIDGDWGKYEFEAWLEQDLKHPSIFHISFPYFRNGRFAGQWTMRAPPRIVSNLFRQIDRAGWFKRQGWPLA